METSCLEASLGAKRPRLSQEEVWAWLPSFIQFPSSLPSTVLPTCLTN